MSDGNANGLSQAEQALSRAADFVDTARGDVTKQCQNLGDQMGVLAGQWLQPGRANGIVVTQAVVDANALKILDQEIRDAPDLLPARIDHFPPHELTGPEDLRKPALEAAARK